MGWRWNNFLLGFLPVSYDSNHYLGPPNSDWCCSFSFQGGIFQLFGRRESLCMCLTHALSSAIFLIRLAVWEGCGEKKEGPEGSLSLKWELPFTFSCCLWELWVWRPDHQAMGCISTKPGDGGWPTSRSHFVSGGLLSSERGRWVDMNW